jgi:Trypsin
LYGWGGDLTYPRNDLVTVRGSEFCNSNSTEAFCTIFDTKEHDTCSANLGSPVVCRNEIAGFSTNNGSCTTVRETQNVLNYQSIGNFYDWIYETTTYSTVENTIRFIVNVAHFTFPDLNSAVVRCAASIITNVHVLTTATCVKVKSPLEIAVEVTTTTENSDSSG